MNELVIMPSVYPRQALGNHARHSGAAPLVGGVRPAVGTAATVEKGVESLVGRARPLTAVFAHEFGRSSRAGRATAAAASRSRHRCWWSPSASGSKPAVGVAPGQLGALCARALVRCVSRPSHRGRVLVGQPQGRERRPDIDDYYGDGDHNDNRDGGYGFSGAHGLLAVPLRHHGSRHRE